MGIGFAASRFGLFLREIRGGPNLPQHGTGISVYSGVLLVLLGVVVNVAAMVYHVGTIRRLQAGSWQPSVARNAVALAVLLAAIGVGMAVFCLL